MAAERFGDVARIACPWAKGAQKSSQPAEQAATIDVQASCLICVQPFLKRGHRFGAEKCPKINRSGNQTRTCHNGTSDKLRPKFRSSWKTAKFPLGPSPARETTDPVTKAISGCSGSLPQEKPARLTGVLSQFGSAGMTDFFRFFRQGQPALPLVCAGRLIRTTVRIVPVGALRPEPFGHSPPGR